MNYTLIPAAVPELNSGAILSSELYSALQVRTHTMKSIPPFRLRLEPLSAEAEKLPGFTWAEPPVGSRHQLGGEPEADMATPWPNCPECGCEMTFYGQLDSINDEYCIADSGLILIYYCFECIEVVALVESS